MCLKLLTPIRSDRRFFYIRLTLTNRCAIFAHMKKTKKKKLIPRHVRNRHAKEMRRFLKNHRIKVDAKTICLS